MYIFIFFQIYMFFHLYSNLIRELLETYTTLKKKNKFIKFFSREILERYIYLCMFCYYKNILKTDVKIIKQIPVSKQE